MIKLFTHQSDPDGIGCAILALLSYEDVDFSLCKGVQELDKSLLSFLESDVIEKYEAVYITDLCPSDELLQKIDNNTLWKNKVHVFDHHQTGIDEMTKNYSFVTSIVKKDGLSCCGTSLFYEYILTDKKVPLLESTIMQEFVEMTRLHDTWEWKGKNDFHAFHLQTLFQLLGSYGYYYHFLEKLRTQKSMEYTVQEQNWIELQELKNQQLVEELAKHIVVETYEGYQMGMVFGEYAVRNNLAEYLNEFFPELDIMVLFAVDNRSVSFHSLKEHVNVRALAEKYGGGGHESASSVPLANVEQLLLQKVFK